MDHTPNQSRGQRTSGKTDHGAFRVPLDSGVAPVRVEVGEPGETASSPEWFEDVYRKAAGELGGVPWAKGRANPSVVAWLNAEAPGRVRPGSRAVVVGCGLGDDVVELLARGYDASGFDVSSCAIEWARNRFPMHSTAFSTADLLNLPPRLRHRHELVVEVSTIQAMPPEMREDVANAIASLCAPRGTVLVVCRACEGDVPPHAREGPPWPLTSEELAHLMNSAGLRPVRAIDDYVDDEVPAVRRLRGVFERA